MNLLRTLAANKHTSGAAVVWIVAAAFEMIGPIWFPAHAEQFKQTGEAIKTLAVGYGLLAAGDAGAKPTDQNTPKP